jgi:large subunit ribosomal protein L24
MNRFKPKVHIKKNDTVIILSGDDKGKKGRVLEVMALEGKAIVDGINIVSRHTKPNAKQTQGGIVKKPAPIQISKLALLDPKDGKAVRIGRRMEGNSSVRFSKRSNEVIK